MPEGEWDRKLRSKASQAVYALRKTIVGPVFGQIQDARGLNRLRLRGLEIVIRRMGADGHHPQHPQTAQSIASPSLATGFISPER